jgi:predicted DNA-binding antitoxin AbrB/MazE fold protein
MSLEIEAVYEDGVLKPDKPLPLKEHERVTVSVKPTSEKPPAVKPTYEKPTYEKPPSSRIRQSAGLLRWTGDPEVLRKIAEDPQFGIAVV